MKHYRKISSLGFSWINPVHLLAFGLGIGKIPIMPGTFGTLLGIPLYFFIFELPLWQYVVTVLCLFVIGIAICHKTASDMDSHDNPGIVFDEIVGLLVTYIALPAGWVWLIVGFVLFRLFDIWKPYPISWLDKNVGGGFGIMLDDLLAGVFAAISLQLTYMLWNLFT